VGGGKKKRAAQIPTLNFLLLKNFILVDKRLFKNAQFMVDYSDLNNKIKMLSSDNFLLWKFAVVCRKIATCCPAYFFNRRRR